MEQRELGSREGIKDSRGHQHSGFNLRAQRTRTKAAFAFRKKPYNRQVDSWLRLRGVERSVCTAVSQAYPTTDLRTHPISVLGKGSIYEALDSSVSTHWEGGSCLLFWL